MATETKTQTVAAIVVLDRSGSMGVIRDATIEGLGKYVADLKADDDADNVILSVLQFDHEHEWIIDGKNVTEIRTLPPYEPRGSTALNDAIGRGIAAGDKAQKAGNRVLLVIVTDGQENASVDYPGQDGVKRIRELVQKRVDDDGWVVTYLSADLSSEAWEQSAAYGVARGSTIAYAGSAASTDAAFASVSNVTRATKRVANTRAFAQNTTSMSGTQSDITGSTSADAERMRKMVWDVDKQQFVEEPDAE